MRQFTLLLCLMMVAALRWIIGSVGAPTTTEQKATVFSETHVGMEAVNTGFKVTAVGARVGTGDAAWITDELLSAAMAARPHCTTTNLSRGNRQVEFEFIEIGADWKIKDLPSTSDRARSALMTCL
jgi:hypothetical protein